MNIISSNHRHLLRLIAKDKDVTGWTKVSSIVLPLIKQLPTPLIELHSNEKLVKLTSEGELVIKWVG